MATEKRWVIKDADGNILNEFEGEAIQDVIASEFDGATIASVEQLPDFTPSPNTDKLWSSFRTARNDLLEKSDWTQVSDAPVDQAAWAAYRQALRDLPQNTTDPANPVWPSKPA